MNHLNPRLDCQRFINFFTEAVNTNRYLDVSGQIYYGGMPYPCYIATDSKSRSFKTDKIIEASKRYIQFIKQDLEESLENRVQLLSALDQTLQSYATRIENSIKKRWWYFIFHFFGYQAKVPDNVKLALAAVKEALRGVKGQRELERLQQEAAQNRLTRRQEREELERNINLQRQQNNLIIEQEKAALQLVLQQAEEQLNVFIASVIQKINKIENKDELQNYCGAILDSQLEQLGSRLLSHEKIKSNQTESLLLQLKIFNQRSVIRKAEEKRTLYLDNHLNSEQNLALAESETRLEKTESEIEKIKASWPDRLAEAKKQYSKYLENLFTNKAKVSWLSPTEQLYQSVSREIGKIIAENIHNERFYLPYGQDRNIPELQDFSKKLHKLYDKASMLIEDFKQEAGITKI